MRIFFHGTIIFLIISIFSGCARTNAFTRFDFNTIKERATSSLRTSKIAQNKEIDGVISMIYLNEVNPDKYNGMEYFYMTIYTKEGAALYDPNSLNKTDMILTLNGELPVKIKKLKQDNIFKELIPLNNDWSSYYLVAFPQDKGEKLSLILKNAQFASQPLTYQKGEQ